MRNKNFEKLDEDHTLARFGMADRIARGDRCPRCGESSPSRWVEFVDEMAENG